MVPTPEVWAYTARADANQQPASATSFKQERNTGVAVVMVGMKQNARGRVNAGALARWVYWAAMSAKKQPCSHLEDVRHCVASRKRFDLTKLLARKTRPGEGRVRENK